MLCHFYKVTPAFLEFINSFGYKTANTDSHFTACFSRFNLSDATRPLVHQADGYGKQT